jgi:hypothetical protein
MARWIRERQVIVGAVELVAHHVQRHRHGGERVAQVVADLAGKRGELLVGPLQLPGPQLQLEQVDDAVGQADQRVLLLVRQ